MNGLALCAGIGGLERGVADALQSRGVDYRTVAHVERDAYAAAVLVARMEDATLDPAPIWDDVTTFDARPWRGVVDFVTSGIPCQPYSSAGKRQGHADARALWPQLVRIVEECEPDFVFVENVARFLQHAEPLWRELWWLGFDWAPPLLSTAAEYGAPHLRERVFLLAAHSERGELRDEPRRSDGACGRGARGARDARSNAADTDRAGREGEWCGWVFDRERQTLRHDADGRRCGCRIAGSPWAAQSPVCRVDDGAPDRVDRLRTLGNAVVPAQAEAAFAELMSWHGSRRRSLHLVPQVKSRK